MIDKAISDLHPKFRPLAQRLLELYRATGRRIEVTETWRDPKREDELHAKGITKATGLTCKHCFMLDGIPASLAFDFALYDDDNQYITDGTDCWYADVADIARSLGLKPGADFTHPDYDHIEIPDSLLTEA